MINQKKNKNKYIVLSVVAVIVLAMVILFVRKASNDNQGYRTIGVVEISGTVSVVKDGIEYSAYPGMLLQEGHSIVTASNSHVRLVLDGDKYVKLESGSRAIFETLGTWGSGKTKIVLERGTLTSELVNPLNEGEEYVVNTPNAVLAVRGTLFRVNLSVAKNGETITDVMTYGGRVTSQRILPTGDLVEEEVSIEGGYKTCISMDEKDTIYIVEGIGIKDSSGDGVEDIMPIQVQDVSDADLIDIYFAVENGHEVFLNKEAILEEIEYREIKIEEEVSVYEKAEKVIGTQNGDRRKDISGTIIANDSKPIPIISKVDDDEEKSEFESILGSIVDGDMDEDSERIEVAMGEEEDADSEEVENESQVTGEEETSSESSETTESAESEEESSEAPEFPWEFPILGFEPETEPETEEVPSTEPETEEESSTEAETEEVPSTEPETEEVPSTEPETEEVPSTEPETEEEHVHKTEEVVVDATCTKEGLRKTICNTCGEVLEEETLAMLAHTETTTYTDGTATAEGLRRVHCAVCDETFEEEVLFSIPLHFPDAVFGAYVRENYDTDGHNSLTIEELEEIKKATEIVVVGYESRTRSIVDGGVKSFQGIEYFTGLHSLDCSYNTGLTALDLSANTQLSELKIDFTGITDLNVANTQLTELNLTAFSTLDTLDVTNVPLTYLQVNSENIKQLDLSTNDELVRLDVCGCHNLASLDISACENLENFRASNTLITEFDFSNNNKLSSLMLDSNLSLVSLDLSDCTQLTSLSISSNTNLENLNCSGIASVNLDTASLEALKTLDISNSSIEVLNLMNNVNLTSINVDNSALQILHLNSPYLTEVAVAEVGALTSINLNNCTALTSIDLSQNSALTTFTCGESGLTELDFSANPNLATFTVVTCNNLESLVLDNCANLTDSNMNLLEVPNLKVLDIDNTGLASLEFSNYPSLESVSMYNTAIVAADFSGNANLTTLSIGWWNTTLEELNISNTKISDLNLVGYDNLKTVTMQNCDSLQLLSLTECPSLTSLDTYGCPNLTSLDVSDSAITSLSLSMNQKLENLSFQNTNISLFDVMHNTQLKTLNCSGTPITSIAVQSNTLLSSLNVSNCTQLSTVDVSSNTSLNNLTISGCTGLETLNISNTALTALDCSTCTGIKTFIVENCTALNSERITYPPFTQNAMETIVMTNMAADTANCINFTYFKQLKTLQITGSDMHYLYIDGCDNLTSITLENCSDFMTLVASSTPSLTSLQLIGDMSSLRSIDMSNTAITALNLDPSIVPNLEELNVSNCTSLRELTAQNLKLAFVEAAGCTFTTFNVSGNVYKVPDSTAYFEADYTNMTICGFDPSKVSDVTGGTFDPTTCKFTSTQNTTITYKYQCSDTNQELFTVQLRY